MYCLQYSDPFAGDLFMETNNIPYYSLGNALNNLFLDSQLMLQSFGTSAPRPPGHSGELTRLKRGFNTI